MKINKITLFLIFLVLSILIIRFYYKKNISLNKSTTYNNVNEIKIKEKKKMNKQVYNKKEIYLAGGCFWGLEEYFSRINGVIDVSVGYANGQSEDTNYKILKNTDHAETIHLVYDKDEIDLEEILLYYLRVVDPTSVNKQGNDIGRQYRTGVYFIDENDKEIIEKVFKESQKEYKKPFVVEVEKLKNYILAEEYHQDYLKKNPNGYCHIDVNKAYEPLIDKDKYLRPTNEELKTSLTDLQYKVAVESHTERAFNNEYYNHFEEGIYVDILTKEPLFSSKDKFDSHCGWPSFSKPINSEVVNYHEDNSFNMQRIEIKSRAGDTHLGHVFNDGPKDKGGLRYCVNSSSIRFIKKEDMEKEGYAYLLDIFNE